MKRVRLSRRTLLRGLGIAVALPPLDAMVNDHGLLHGTAYGQSTRPFPKRMVTFYFPCGVPLQNWTPSTTGSSWALTPTLMSLGALRSQVNVITGLSKNGPASFRPGGVAGAGHSRGTGTFATGMPCTAVGAGGPSVEQAAAAMLGGMTRFRSLPVAVDAARTGPADGLSGAHMCNISWSAANTPVPADRDPRTLFDRLFSGSGTPGAAARLAADRLSVLDTVRSDLTRLNGQIGATDRARVDQHLTAIRELERQIMLMGTGPACTAPTRPGTGLSRDVFGRIQMDLLVLALKCDMTRFASFQLANAGSNMSMPWIGVSAGLHTTSHDGSAAGLAQMTRMVAWEVSQFTYLLTAMQAVPEGTGTLLDNSLVFCSSEITAFPSHRYDDMPVLLAGRAGGVVPTGRHLRFSAGTPMNNLFVSMLRAVGATADRFGSDSTGPLPGLLA